MATTPPPLIAMPASFTAGVAVTYTRALTDYPASDWTLKVSIAGASQVVITASAAANGVDHLVTILPSATAAFPAGYYRFQEMVVQKGTFTPPAEAEKHIVGSGPLSLEANLAIASAGSGQSFEEKVLAALEAKIQGRVTTDQETLQIDGTAISRIPFEALFTLRQKFANLVEIQRSPNAAMGSIEINFGQPSLPTIPGFPIPPHGGNW